MKTLEEIAECYLAALAALDKHDLTEPFLDDDNKPIANQKPWMRWMDERTPLAAEECEAAHELASQSAVQPYSTHQMNLIPIAKAILGKREGKTEQHDQTN